MDQGMRMKLEGSSINVLAWHVWSVLQISFSTRVSRKILKFGLTEKM